VVTVTNLACERAQEDVNSKGRLPDNKQRSQNTTPLKANSAADDYRLGQLAGTARQPNRASCHSVRSARTARHASPECECIESPALPQLVEHVQVGVDVVRVVAECCVVLAGPVLQTNTRWQGANVSIGSCAAYISSPERA
jgi:hypothetical protein